VADAAPIETRAAPAAARYGIAVPGLIFGVLAALPAAAVLVPPNYLLALGTRIMTFAIATPRSSGSAPTRSASWPRTASANC
jgi:hypothetical protein